MEPSVTPSVSVIVPVYNTATWLEACLESIANQTFSDFEAILIDDGSTDFSPVIAERFAESDGRFRVIHQQNQGSSAARNRGIELARGAYLLFIDSDDFISPRYLELMYSAVKREGARFSQCMYARGYGENYKQADIFKDVPGETIDEHRLWQGCYGRTEGTHLLIVNKLFHSSVFEKARFCKGIGFEDQIIALELYSNSGIIPIVRESLYFYRKHRGSSSHLPDGVSSARVCEALLERDRYFATKGWADIRVGNLRKLVTYLKLLRQSLSSASPELGQRYEDLRARAVALGRSLMPTILVMPKEAARIIPFMFGDKLYDSLRDAWRKARKRRR